jgi:hypothetical protein
MEVKRRQIVKPQVDMEMVAALEQRDNAIDEGYPDTPDGLFEADKTYEQAEQDLLVFVEKQIDLMDNNLLFGGQDVPSFYSLNKSLMEYESVMLSLIALHQELRVQFDIAKEQYDDFYAQKFVEIKQSQVNLGKSAAFTAAREIEMYVRKNYIKELSALKANIIRTENKYNALNHIISSWEKYSFVLNTLSANARAEANAAGMSSAHPYEHGDESE